MNIKDENIGRTKLEYDSGSVIYKGIHKDVNASEGSIDWWIYKYTYDGTDITDIQEQQGSWTGRATLNW
jgi:hypothetical protein